MDTLNFRSPPRLEWLTLKRVEQYYGWMREENSLSAKSAREHVKWLGRAMKRAVERTELAKNPVDGLELDKGGETLDRLPFSLGVGGKGWN